jgi:hypothetical protein
MGRATTAKREQRRTRRGALVLAVVGAALVVLAAGCGNSRDLPPGRWGQVISCLESHPIFNVYDASSLNAAAPTTDTKAVSVWQTLKGVALAYVGNNVLGADDLTGTGDANVDNAAGPIHFGFSPNADPQNRLDISNCIQNAYPATTETTRATRSTTSTTTTLPTTPTSPSRAPTGTTPAPCNSSHSAYFRCATAAAPYCEQGQCSYPAPSSGPCASGYTRTLVPSTSAYVCQQTNTATAIQPPRSPTSFAAGDHNPHDASASTCATTAEIGPQSDCALEQRVLQDLGQGVWSAPGSDTVTIGSSTITFNCSTIGTRPGQVAPVYLCVSQTDAQDWFAFEFT